MATFIDRLAEQVRQCRTPVLVGLDPRWEELPPLPGMMPSEDRPRRTGWYSEFCRGVIDVVAPLVAAVKVQVAFFEQLGLGGMMALHGVLQHARKAGLLVIIDGKRNDIGSTAAAYADGYLGSGPTWESAWGADALTVNPYLGDDSLRPFVEVCQRREAGIFVLVKTSNPGGGTFQDLVADGWPIYSHVGQYVEELAVQTLGDCGYGSVGAVVGATYPQQLAELREAMPHTWFLVPGFGSQGATAKDVAAAFDARGLGAIINSSRAIIFAHSRPEYAKFGAARWQEAVEAATRDMIEQLRSETPAGKL